MAAILTAEDVVWRIAAECAYVMTAVASAFVWSPRLRSCGSTESNSGHGSASAASARETASPAPSDRCRLGIFCAQLLQHVSD
jgi:hypothetical protein